MKFENCDIHDNTIIENAQITAAGTIIDVKTGQVVGDAKPVDVEEVVAEEVTEEKLTDNSRIICDNCSASSTRAELGARSKENNIEFPQIFEVAPSQAFSHPTDLTRECVKMAVEYCYTGQPTQLAYVMICCFAYNLSNNLSGYKSFIRSLMLWGSIPYNDDQVQQIANTMGYKVRSLHPDFRKWGDDLAAEKAICEEIGKMFESRHCWYRYR